MQCKGTPGGGALILFSGDDRVNNVDGLPSAHLKETAIHLTMWNFQLNKCFFTSIMKSGTRKTIINVKNLSLHKTFMKEKIILTISNTGTPLHLVLTCLVHTLITHVQIRSVFSFSSNIYIVEKMSVCFRISQYEGVTWYLHCTCVSWLNMFRTANFYS